jgi:hypothetical protein
MAHLRADHVAVAQLGQSGVAKLESSTGLRQNLPMTVSRTRVGKTETRDMADRDRVVRYVDNLDWKMSNATFFTAFVVIAAVLAGLALLLR